MSLLNRLRQIAAKAPAPPPVPPVKVVPTQPTAPKPCSACRRGWIHQTLNFMSGVVHLADALAHLAVDDKVPQDEHDRRKRICEECPIRDPKGDPLFRDIGHGRFSCGAPATHKLLRDPQVDGCGCFLNLKWWIKGERCPLKDPRWKS